MIESRHYLVNTPRRERAPASVEAADSCSCSPPPAASTLGWANWGGRLEQTGSVRYGGWVLVLVWQTVNLMSEDHRLVQLGWKRGFQRRTGFNVRYMAKSCRTETHWQRVRYRYIDLYLYIKKKNNKQGASLTW